MSNTHEIIANTSPEKKREILAQLLRQKALQSHSFLLSFAQQRLWFLNQLQPDNASYNEPCAMRLKGSLNLSVLEQSLNEIVRRHEILRTTFTVVDGQPVQVVAPTLTLTLPVVNLQMLPPKQQEAEVEQLTTQEARQLFDLAEGPLLRVTLLQLGTAEYVVLFTMHHIICDLWSFGILIEELAALYNAFSHGQSSPLPELPIQYADFAVWQRQWLHGEVLEGQLSYWKQQLGSHLPVLQLPTTFPRPVVQTFRGARKSFCLPTDLTEGLKALSRDEGITLFMTLLAAFKTLLHRYTHQDDILVGSPIANRNRSELEGLIGFFVNTLVLRTNLGGNPTFRELLRRVHNVTLGAYSHQDLPFEYLVKELQLDRSLSHNPIFQVAFAFHNAPTKELKLSGLTLSPLKQEKQTANFDLTLFMEDTESGLTGVFEYNTELFDAATINRMADHFYTLLESIVTHPEHQLSDLSLLTTAEQQQLLVEWNDTRADYPKDLGIHQLFEAQVERTPDAVAVVFEEQQLTYRELNARANQLAHYLQKLGVAPEVLVGICLERSLDMIVGLLGILKAGGAYVPLDPSYPQERLSYMLADSGVEVLLTQSSLLESLPEHQAQVVGLDTDWEAIEQHAQDNLDAGVHSDNLAYVIYTSGSTGQPKGVAIEHQATVNHMSWMQSCFPLKETDKVIQKTPFSFDASVWEFYAPLLVGAQLVMARPGGHQDSNYLIQIIREQKITILQLVPTLLQMLLEHRDIGTCTSLKRVFCGGEALPVELQERFFAHLKADLHNLYGPTETCIDATFWTGKGGINQQVVPIGRPIANTQIYILDKHLQPVPIGVPGELYIGGDGLARCYLNRPKLTQEKFIRNPFSDSKSERLYKTGDLARYLPDGNIEFLGRIDHQVKVRGFRIELGEIEAVLSQHPGVREAVVAAREEQGSKHLVAYTVFEPEQAPTITELRRFLEEKLPSYMVPSAFVPLDALPLTPNGKVDRKALPAPEALRPELDVAYVMPQTEAEQAIAKVWQKALKIEKIGIHDNFFELGGHSLLLVQVNSQLRELFNTDLSLIEMFRYPTISALAKYFSQVRNQQSSLLEEDIQTEKVKAAKAQQQKRRQKMQSQK